MSDQTQPAFIKANTANPTKVAAVVAFVAANPGCTKKAASTAPGVAKQASYGYLFVQAALDQGLIKGERQYDRLGRPFVLTVV